MDKLEMESVFLACLRRIAEPGLDGRLRDLDADDWQALISTATDHGVSSILKARLQENGLDSLVPSEASEALLAQYRGDTALNMRTYATLQKVETALRDREIEVLALKGAVLAEKVYPDMGHRQMSDLDLLIRRDRLAEAYQVVQGLGFSPLYPGEAVDWIDEKQHVPGLWMQGSTMVELHGSIASPSRPYAIDSDELWERSLEETIAGVPVRVLSPEDLLLHVCCHLSYMHGFEFGVRPFVDIAEIIHHYGPGLSWPVVVQRATSWNWKRGMYLSLRLARDLVGADVPDDVLAGLRPDGLSDEIVDAARAQMLRAADHVPTGLAEFHGHDSILRKASVFLKNVFLSREAMARLYPVSANSPRVYLYYPKRIVDAFTQYGRVGWELLRGRSDTVGQANRTRALQTWLLADHGSTPGES